ncbi:MAG: glycine oxidase ThiO [Fimbriimonadia bacterium]|nr:glycine oxidase ThiO [Fimbriimonadia bacterium]
MESRTVIIGAGVIGLGIAYELAKRGERPLVLEQQPSGGETSSASAGMINPFSLTGAESSIARWGLESLHLFPEWASDLRERTGMEIGWQQAGAFKIAYSEEEHRGLKEALAWIQPLDPQADWIDIYSARSAEPLIGPEAVAALWLPNEGQAHTSRLLDALRAVVIKMGGEIRGGQRVTGFDTRRARAIRVRLQEEDAVDADRFVIAAGAWSAALLKPLGIDLPLRPTRGQSILLHDAAAPLQRNLVTRHNYIVPKEGGAILLGATVEEAGLDRRVTAGGIASLLNSLSATFPALGNATLTHFAAGLRPSTPNDEPFIGAVPGWDNLWIATGHGRHGILLAPWTAQRLAEGILNGNSELAMPAPVVDEA